MNQKKCPKCGEMNPGEAVMCWACYTPLTGAAMAAGAGGGMATVGAPAVAVHDDQGQKKAIPPWQMGAVALGLLVLLGVGYKTMAGGTPDPGPIDTPVVVDGPRIKGPGNPPPVVVQPGAPIQGPGGNAPIGPIPLPYTTISSPNPKSEWGVMGIVPTQQNIGNARAASLAAAAYNQYKGTGWKAMHIYVFDSSQAGQTFSDYQLGRHSEVLEGGDYTRLSGLWSHCLARLEFNGVKASVTYPNQQPNNWWTQ